MTFVYTKKQMEAIYAVIALLLTGVAGGYVVGNYEKPYDPYADRALNTVDPVMQDYIKSPTDENNDAAFNVIFDQNRWAERNYNEAFTEYLNACDDLRLAILHSENKETIKMKTKVMTEKRAVFE